MIVYAIGYQTEPTDDTDDNWYEDSSFLAVYNGSEDSYDYDQVMLWIAQTLARDFNGALYWCEHNDQRNYSRWDVHVNDGYEITRYKLTRELS